MHCAVFRTSNRKVVGSTPVGRTRNFFFRECLCHSLKNIILIYGLYLGEHGWRSVRAFASHQCGPGSIPGLGVISGLSLLVLYSAPRGFSPGTPVFPSPLKHDTRRTAAYGFSVFFFPNMYSAFKAIDEILDITYLALNDEAMASSWENILQMMAIVYDLS